MGCGGISRRFAKNVVSSGDGELVAVAAREGDRAEAFAAAFGAGKAYGDYEALASDPGVDVVYIGTINVSHYELTKLCLERGKPVICEKPMVLREAEAIELTRIAARKGVLLMEAMWSRCNPCIIEATRWVREGKLGIPRLVTASASFNSAYNPESRLYSRELGGGAIYDIGVYAIELATGLLGENPVSANGIITRVPTGVDGMASISLGFPSGALASLTAGIQASARKEAQVYGSEAWLELDDYIFGARKLTLHGGRGEVLEEFTADFEDGFSFEVAHVIDLFRKGMTESPLIPWKDTIACAAVFDKLLGL
jgi:predicted dehydrogenase